MVANVFLEVGGEDNVSNDAFEVTVDAVSVGLAVASVAQLEAQISTVPIQYQQDATPRAQRITDQPITLNIAFNELTNVNFQNYLGGLAEINAGIVYYGEKRGQQLPQFEIKLFSLAPAGNPWSGKVFTFHKASFTPNGSIAMDPSTDDPINLPVTITVFKDSTQSTGREFFSLGAASVLVPTLVSTLPADGAAAVVVGDDIVITFGTTELGIGSFNNLTVRFTTTGKTSTAFDEVIIPTSMTLDSTKKILTIVHAALSALTEYQITLVAGSGSSIGIRSDDSVPLAADYVFDFTTA